jgi:hypothetical protein
MIKNILNHINYLCILFVLPLLTGCIGGPAGTTNGLAADITGGGGGGAGFATIHNPEPTTMLLMGGGMMAAAFYKKSLKK